MRPKGEMVLSIVRNYMANGWVSQLKHRGLPLVYVISPFKSVAREFRSLLGRTRTKWAPEVSGPAFEIWLKASVGTVHTFQGKEQETVVPQSANRGFLAVSTRSSVIRFEVFDGGRRVPRTKGRRSSAERATRKRLDRESRQSVPRRISEFWKRFTRILSFAQAIAD